jgi:hypothetical protein
MLWLALRQAAVKNSIRTRRSHDTVHDLEPETHYTRRRRATISADIETPYGSRPCRLATLCSTGVACSHRLGDIGRGVWERDRCHAEVDTLDHVLDDGDLQAISARLALPVCRSSRRVDAGKPVMSPALTGEFGLSLLAGRAERKSMSRC